MLLACTKAGERRHRDPVLKLHAADLQGGEKSWGHRDDSKVLMKLMFLDELRWKTMGDSSSERQEKERRASGSS